MWVFNYVGFESILVILGDFSGISKILCVQCILVIIKVFNEDFCHFRDFECISIILNVSHFGGFYRYFGGS